jgi:hypothetical protein
MQKENNQTNTMNWGKWIVVAFVLFAGFIATLVTVCMRQDVSLVSKDYYKDELNYQDQISRMNNVNQLDQKPVIQKSGNFLVIDFDQFKDIQKGQLKLFNPSDAKKDRVYMLQSSAETKQSFPIDDVAKGMYRARMQWVMNGREYYIETVITI